MPVEDPSSEMPGPELTLIVAATRNMGIGRNGTLPWTGLKKEMAYFARVTKRLPSHLVSIQNLLFFYSYHYYEIVKTRLDMFYVLI